MIFRLPPLTPSAHIVTPLLFMFCQSVTVGCLLCWLVLDAAGSWLRRQLQRQSRSNAALPVCHSLLQRHVHEPAAVQLRHRRSRRQCRLCRTAPGKQQQQPSSQHSFLSHSAFHPSGVGKRVPAMAGKAKAGMVHADYGWMHGCAGKTVRSFENTWNTWALLRWWFTKRRYIKCTYLYLVLLANLASLPTTPEEDF